MSFYPFIGPMENGTCFQVGLKGSEGMFNLKEVAIAIQNLSSGKSFIVGGNSKKSIIALVLFYFFFIEQISFLVF